MEHCLCTPCCTPTAALDTLLTWAEWLDGQALTLDEGEEMYVPVVTGFLARGRETRAVTTLGRGGSDLTATVIGAALGHAEVQVSAACDARGGHKAGTTGQCTLTWTMRQAICCWICRH